MVLKEVQQSRVFSTLLLLSPASARPLKSFLVCLTLLLQPLIVLLWRNSPLAWASPAEFFIAGCSAVLWAQEQQNIRGASSSPEDFEMLNFQKDLL